MLGTHFQEENPEYTSFYLSLIFLTLWKEMCCLKLFECLKLLLSTCQWLTDGIKDEIRGEFLQKLPSEFLSQTW